MKSTNTNNSFYENHIRYAVNNNQKTIIHNTTKCFKFLRMLG